MKLKGGDSPSDGFFYISKIRLSGDESPSLTSSFVSEDGNTSFWEEAVEVDWDTTDSDDEYLVSISGSEIGAEIDDEANPELVASVEESADDDDLEDVFKIEVAFKKDGDSEEDLVVSQEVLSVSEASIEICDDDRWSELGYE